jgi:cytochrome c-type biogenesis protein CcsB
MLRPDAYRDADIVYVKKKQVRQRIGDVLSNSAALDPQRLLRFKETGLISPDLLQQPEVISLLGTMETDLLRTAKSVDAIRSALSVRDPRTLSRLLRMVPPPGGSPSEKWRSMDVFLAPPDAPHDATHAGLVKPIEGLDDETRSRLTEAWQSLVSGWQEQNAATVNKAVAHLAGLLPEVAPGLYPDARRLSWESWYFRYKNMTWVWLVYLLAVIPLLMSVIYRWGWARALGMTLFAAAFGLHTAALLLRWYVAQRWPNSNMFEAVTTAAWFGGVVALALEILVRSTALRNLFALGSAGASMAALMAAYYLPLTLSAQIGNKMPILHDVWLYIHTNVIIASYCLIAMASVSALLYLGYRVVGSDRRVADAGGAGSLILAGSPAGSFLKSQERASAGQVLDAATMVLMELSFVMLWTGLVMGAIWADHSWGRPWGWDPKEVFALNTFIIFLLLVHVRFKVRDKGLWTALLAVVGCGVMLFNWIVVNFVITGLHSYA